MAEFRQSPIIGAMAQAGAAGGSGGGDGGPGRLGLPVHRILWALRRHLVAAVFAAAFVTTAVVLILQQSPRYRATTTIRLAGERRQLSAGMVEPTAPADRTMAPLLSLVPRVRSRDVVGKVVDSLGLQLAWLPEQSGWGGLGPPLPPAVGLGRVEADPIVRRDTLEVTFTTRTFRIRTGDRVADARYGEIVKVGGVAFTVPAAPGRPRARLVIHSRDRAIDLVLDRLAAVPVVGTDALEVRFTDPDPDRAQSVANAVATTFHASSITAAREQASRRRKFMADQLQETERLLRRAQGGLSAFRRRQQMASSADGLAMQQAGIANIETRRIEVEADRRVYLSLLDQLQGGQDSSRQEGLRMLAYSPEIATNPVIERLYQQMLVQRSRLDSLTTGPWRSSGTNPDVVQLQGMLRSSQQELVRAVQASLKSLDDRSRALTELRNSNADALRAMPALQAEENYLGEEVASLSSLAGELRREYQKSRMAEALQAGDVDVVDLAALPYEPSGVPWWLKLAIGLAAGLVAGTVLAVLLDARSRAIRAPEDLTQAVPVRELALIPNVKGTSAGGGLAAVRARLRGEISNGRSLIPDDTLAPSAGVEAFRRLYASLTFGWGDGPRTVLVTSVAPQEGKTLVASNLAVTFAREGARVLLIDADRWRPQLHRLFHLPRSPGLADLFTTQVTSGRVRETDSREPPPAPGYTFFPEAARSSGASGATPNLPAPVTPERHPVEPPSVVRSTPIARLWLLPCGTTVAHPAEVLRVEGMRRVLGDLATRFDLIVIDSPPVLVSADAAMLAPLTDGVLLVVRAGETDRGAAQRAYEQLSAAGAAVLGTVLNDPSGEVTRYRSEYYSYDYPPALD